VCHLDELVLNVRRVLHAVVLGHLSRGSDDHVAKSALAHIAAAMIGGESFHEHRSKLRFAVHEDELIGDENAVQDHHRFLSAKGRVAGIDVAALHRARVARLTPVDVGNAFRLHRDRADYSVCLVIFSKPHSRHHDEPVRIEAARLVGLRTGNVNAFVGPFNHMNEKVRVRLLMRRKAAVAFYISHRTADHEIQSLHFGDEALQAFLIIGLILFVDLERRRIERVECVHPDAALKTRSGKLPEPTLHLVLQNHVIAVHCDVKKTVHTFVREWRNGARKFGFAHREVICFSYRVDTWAYHRVIHGFPDHFAEKVNLKLPVAKGVYVVFGGSNWRFDPRFRSDVHGRMILLFGPSGREKSVDRKRILDYILWKFYRTVSRNSTFPWLKQLISIRRQMPALACCLAVPSLSDMPRNGSQKSVDRAQEIYLTAAQLFFERGFELTSVSDIADALHLTKAGLYYYFESKQELLFKIVTLGLDDVKNAVLDPARSVVDPEARLRFIILNHSRLAAEGNHAVIIISHEINSLTADQREAVMKRRREYFEFVRETLLELRDAGKLRELDITTATFTLFGMILWLPRWYRSNGKLPVENVCQSVCDMALNGLMRN
jgi:TetR/AcrR family transcriptional regulator, cholesterol catabolism regulator